MADPTELFDQPSSGDLFDANSLHGSLLLIWPTSLEEGITTEYGEADAIRARILVVDGDRAGEELDNTLIFPRVLVSTLKPQIGRGRPALGRLGQGVAKGKQDPPWILEPFTEEDAAAAVAAMSGAFGGTAEEKPAAKTAAAKPTAKVTPKVEAITAQQKTLAESLAKSNVPAETIAEATGATLKQLAKAGIIELV